MAADLVRATASLHGRGPASERPIAAAWAGFVRWCCAHNLPVLPAALATVAAYYANNPARLSPGTLAERFSMQTNTVTRVRCYEA